MMINKKLFLFSLSISLLVMNVHSYADSEIGKQTYTRLCVSCHGVTGAGDGPAGKAFPPGMMPKLNEGTVKYAVDRDKVVELIKKGGAAVGLSPIMPQHPMLSDEDLGHLADYVLVLMGKSS